MAFSVAGQVSANVQSVSRIIRGPVKDQVRLGMDGGMAAWMAADGDGGRAVSCRVRLDRASPDA